MPFLRCSGDLDCHYALSGSETAPVVVLAHSLGADHRMWDPQVAALDAGHRVLRYDLRGHGRSSATPGPYTIEQLARDVLALLDGLRVPRAHFCGLSIGGLIGMWLGANAPARISRLALCNTSARIGSSERWNARIESVAERGMAGISSEVLERWFTPAVRERAPDVIEKTRRTLEATPPAGYVACSIAIRAADLRGIVPGIRVPTLVISGRHDPATTPAEGRWLAEAIPGARFVELSASHLSNLEAAEAFNAELGRFLAD
jgi:3-oxoadipate enol-lactonase